MPIYTNRTHRSTKIVCILLALLTSYVSFYLLLNLAWTLGFDFDNFPLFPIKPLDPITSAIYYGERANTSLFILDLPIFLMCFYAWWVGAFHGHDVALETPEERESRFRMRSYAESGEAIHEARWGYGYYGHHDWAAEEQRESERQARLRLIPSLEEENEEKRRRKLLARTPNQVLRDDFKVDFYRHYTKVCLVIGVILLSVDVFVQWYTSLVRLQTMYFDKNDNLVKIYYTFYPYLGIGIIVGVISIALLIFGVLFYRKYGQKFDLVKSKENNEAQGD